MTFIDSYLDTEATALEAEAEGRAEILDSYTDRADRLHSLVSHHFENGSFTLPNQIPNRANDFADALPVEVATEFLTDMTIRVKIQSAYGEMIPWFSYHSAAADSEEVNPIRILPTVVYGDQFDPEDTTNAISHPPINQEGIAVLLFLEDVFGIKSDKESEADVLAPLASSARVINTVADKIQDLKREEYEKDFFPLLDSIDPKLKRLHSPAHRVGYPTIAIDDPRPDKNQAIAMSVAQTGSSGRSKSRQYEVNFHPKAGEAYHVASIFFAPTEDTKLTIAGINKGQTVGPEGWVDGNRDYLVLLQMFDDYLNKLAEQPTEE